MVRSVYEAMTIKQLKDMVSEAYREASKLQKILTDKEQEAKPAICPTCGVPSLPPRAVLDSVYSTTARTPIRELKPSDI